jgi:hypothetical protein
MLAPPVSVGTTGYLAAGIGLAVLAILASRPVVQDWRGGGQPTPPKSWAYSERLWIAWERSTLPAYLGVVFGLVPVSVLAAVEPDKGSIGEALGIGSAFATVTFIVLSLSTAVFARPRFLIPRGLREQPSLFRELLNDK